MVLISPPGPGDRSRTVHGKAAIGKMPRGCQTRNARADDLRGPHIARE